MRIIIAGGAGFIGRTLQRLWKEKHDLVILSRSPGDGYIAWDGKTLGTWKMALQGADVLLNLAGRSVNCRYTEENQKAIYDSRLDSTRVLGLAMAESKNPPKIWLNSSSATIYRHSLDTPMTEEGGELGTGFSVDVCQKWEATFFQAPTEARRVALRSSMVMGSEPGGPFRAMLALAQLGLGGKMAGGKQMMSWIHELDFARALDWIIESEDLEGVINVAGPNPLPQAEFMKHLRDAVGMRIGLPAAKWMLEVGAAVLGTETELLLKSRYAVPERLLKSGFEFEFPTWREAAMDLTHTVLVG